MTGLYAYTATSNVSESQLLSPADQTDHLESLLLLWPKWPREQAVKSAAAMAILHLFFMAISKDFPTEVDEISILDGFSLDEYLFGCSFSTCSLYPW